MIFQDGAQVLALLITKHGGYFDMVAELHETACVRRVSRYTWDGMKYKRAERATCDFCAAEEGAPLAKLCRGQGSTLFDAAK